MIFYSILALLLRRPTIFSCIFEFKFIIFDETSQLYDVQALEIRAFVESINNFDFLTHFLRILLVIITTCLTLSLFFILPALGLLHLLRIDHSNHCILLFIKWNGTVFGWLYPRKLASINTDRYTFIVYLIYYLLLFGLSVVASAGTYRDRFLNFIWNRKNIRLNFKVPSFFKFFLAIAVNRLRIVLNQVKVGIILGRRII